MEVIHAGELNCLVGTRFFFSPTHDLVLIFSGSRRLQLSPIDLSRKFFQSKFPRDVRAFSWDCYGRTFTVASEDNRISVHNIELNGRSIHSFKSREVIRDVHWIRSPNLSHFFNPDDIKRDLERLRKVPTFDNYDEKIIDRTPLVIKKKNGIHILCVASDHNLRFYFYSIFQFCSIRLKRFIRDIENVQILKSSVSPNFMVTSILFKHNDLIKLIVLNTRKLGICKSALFVVSQNFSHLSRILLHIKKIVVNIQKLWKLFYHGLFKGKLMMKYRQAFFSVEDRIYREKQRRIRLEKKRKKKLMRREERRRERERAQQSSSGQGQDDESMDMSIDSILDHSLEADNEEEEDLHETGDGNDRMNDEDEEEDDDSDDSDDERERREAQQQEEEEEDVEFNPRGFTLEEKDFKDFRNFEETCEHMKNFFIQYILYGKLNQGLIDFLTKHLHEGYIVRILRCFKFLRRGIVTYILKYLTHYILHGLYRLSWLQGCTKWRDKFGSLGMKESDILELIKEFENMHVQSRMILNRVNDFSKNFLTFLQYLRYLHFVEILNDEPDQKNLEYPLTQYIDDGEIKHFLLDLGNLESIGIEELLETFERAQKKFLPTFNPVSKNLSRFVKKIGTITVSAKELIPANIPTHYYKKMKQQEERQKNQTQKEEEDDDDEVMMMDKSKMKQKQKLQMKSSPSKGKKKMSMKKKSGILIEMKNMESYQFFGFLYERNKIVMLKWDTAKRVKFKREILVLHIPNGMKVNSFKFLHLLHPNTLSEVAKHKKFGRIICHVSTTTKGTNQKITKTNHLLGVIDLRDYPFSPIIPKLSIDRLVRTKGPHHVKLKEFEVLKVMPEKYDFLDVRDGNIEKSERKSQLPESSSFCLGCVYSSVTNYISMFRMSVDEKNDLILDVNIGRKSREEMMKDE